MIQRSFIFIILSFLLIFGILNDFKAQEENYIINWKKNFQNKISDLSISSNAEHLAVAIGNEIKIINRYGEIIFSYEEDLNIAKVKISKNSKYVFAATNESKFLFFEKTNSGYNLSNLNVLESNIKEIDISSNGNLSSLITSNKIYFLNSSGEIFNFKNIAGKPLVMDVSSKGDLVAVGTDTYKLHLYNKKGEKILLKTLTNMIISLDISQDSEYIAIGTNDRKVHLMHRNGTVLWSVTLGSSPLFISVDEYANYILVGTILDRIYLLNKNGTILWSKIFFYEIKDLKILQNISVLTLKYFYLYNINGELILKHELNYEGVKIGVSFDNKFIGISSEFSLFLLTILLNETYTITETYTTTVPFFITLTKNYTNTVIEYVTEYNSEITYYYTLTKTDEIIITKTEKVNNTLISFQNVTLLGTTVQTVSPIIAENLSIIIALIIAGSFIGIGIGVIIAKRKVYY